MANGTSSSAIVARVRYRERQVLRTADLTAEQTYLMEMRRRHNIGSHIWGVALGLQLSMHARDLIVGPGLAIDGYGRELILDNPTTVPESVLLNPGADTLDVWLQYGLAQADAPQLGVWECGASLYSRTDEVANIVVTAAAGAVDPRSPPDVAQEDLDFSPDREPVDSPAQTWSVYLGRLQRSAAGGAFAAQAADRAWCGLVGRSVQSPSAPWQMQVDGEIPEQPARFAVGSGDSTGTFNPNLAVDRAGNVSITGETTLNNNLQIADAPGDQSWGLGFSSSASPPTKPMPWQIYRAAVPVQDGSPIQQLRVEMGSPDKKADPKSFLVAVCYPAGSVLNYGLSITSDLTVTVGGNLIVKGQLVEGPVQASSTDPRFNAAALNAWAAGITAGSQSPLTATLAVRIGNLDQTVAGQQANYSITVTNQGPGDVTNVHAYEVLVLNGVAVEAATDLAPQGISLTASASTTFQRSYTPTAAGEFVVSVTAIAVVPTGLTTQVRARQTFTITSPDGGLQ